MTTAPVKNISVKNISAKKISAKKAPAKKAPAKKASKTPVPAKPAQTSWQVYIVRCADDTLYTGIARDVHQRVAEHNGQGRSGARYTRARRPVTLAYQEDATDRSEAGKREYAIKQLPRSAKLALMRRSKRAAKS